MTAAGGLRVSGRVEAGDRPAGVPRSSRRTGSGSFRRFRRFKGFKRFKRFKRFKGSVDSDGAAVAFRAAAWQS
jgi:hypothetical protein